MFLPISFLVASLIVFAVCIDALQYGKEAPIQAVGIQKNAKRFGGQAIANDENLAKLAPPSQLGKKNATMPRLKDRSLELVERQYCDAGYGYCSSFGRCCPESTQCCAWGYCIEPEYTCCPDGPCESGWDCCGANCSPSDSDCCLDGNYCEAGNICVKLYSSSSIVCCTDLDCTAAVISGTTTYVSTTTIDTPSITEPPALSTTEVFTVGDTYTTYTWYWTVTWWYYSFYWTTIQDDESSVDYTRVYETTTFTTIATDEFEASSLFAELSETLSFEPPASAQTSLASWIDGLPSETAASEPEASASLGGLDVTGLREGTGTSGTVTRTGSSSTETASSEVSTAGPSGVPGGLGDANGMVVQWGFVALGVGSAVLMVWL